MKNDKQQANWKTKRENEKNKTKKYKWNV